MHPACRCLGVHSCSPGMAAQWSPASTKWIFTATGSGKVRGDRMSSTIFLPEIPPPGPSIPWNVGRSCAARNLLGWVKHPGLLRGQGQIKVSEMSRSASCQREMWCWSLCLQQNAPSGLEQDATPKILLNLVLSFFLTCLWSCISSENNSGSIGCRNPSFSPMVCHSHPAWSQNCPRGCKYPKAQPGWQLRPCRIWGMLLGGALCSFQPDPFMVLAWIVFTGTKEKKKIKLGFPLFHLIFSFWAGLRVSLRKTVKRPIKSNHHKAT